MNRLDCEGRNLRELLDESAPLPIAQSVAIGAQVAYELAHAHDRGFVHRGVRPANIVVHRGPRYSNRIGSARLCATGVSSGGPGDALDYQSPEQIRGETAIDGRADVFALGVVLYEMLTGRLPDTASEPRLPSELNPHVPPEVDGLVLAMLARERDDRLPTAIVAGHGLQRINQQLRSEIAANEPFACEVKPARAAVDRLLRTSLMMIFAAVAVGFIGGLVYLGGKTVTPIAPLASEPKLAAVTPQPLPMEPPAVEESPAETPPLQEPVGEPPTKAVTNQGQAPRSPTSATEKRPATTTRAPVPPRAKPAPVRPKPHATPRVAKPETAKVIISVSPWAEIYVNGTRRGTTPPVSVIELSPGMHRIDIRHTAQPAYLAFVNVKAGETRKLRHDFVF